MKVPAVFQRTPPVLGLSSVSLIVPYFSGPSSSSAVSSCSVDPWYSIVVFFSQWKIVDLRLEVPDLSGR